MHELAAGVDSINPLYGPVLNPFNLTMHVGGSRYHSDPALPSLPDLMMMSLPSTNCLPAVVAQELSWRPE